MDNGAQHQPGSSDGVGNHLHKQGNSASASSSSAGGLHNGSAPPVHNMAMINPSLLISKEDDVSCAPAYGISSTSEACLIVLLGWEGIVMVLTLS